jgi:hypothetical protein
MRKPSRRVRLDALSFFLNGNRFTVVRPDAPYEKVSSWL